MRARRLTLGLLTIVFLGIVAWQLNATGAVERLVGAPCAGGRCVVPLPKPQTVAQTIAERGAGWPPRVGQRYPDLELIDQTGALVRLSSFEGSVMLIEPVGMTCAACQAFSGAHRVGAFGGVVPQAGLPSIDELLPRFAGGVQLSDERIVFVQLILYSMSMGAPSAEDVRAWAKHFGFERSKNRIVLAGSARLLGPASFNMIPGFQLVDRNFVLRADSTGHSPRHSLFDDLLPMIPRLLERRSVEDAYRAIPHRRTVFDVDAARMSREERLYLHTLFTMVDLAVVERVDTLSALQRGATGSRDDYDALLRELGALRAPETLRGVHRLVVEAITEQRTALAQWRTAGPPHALNGHPLVVSSSTKLRQAYAELMRLFPDEREQNKAAFFDYLCALDFI